MGKVDALLNSFTKIDEEFFEELEENLIMAD
ncbi:signal recognition particle receptor subunit alpha, partial [Negativibacillus massiliensis]